MFQDVWEENYKKKLGLNKYPWDFVVSFVFSHCKKNIPKQKQKILELGFGSGCNVVFFAREGFDSYGVEASSEAYNHALDWLKREDLSANLKKQTFTQLPYENEFFDLIVDRGSLTCIPYDDCQKIFHEVKSVLKKDGVFLFSPYSKVHTSSLTGHTNENGLTTITQGSLVGVGDLCFYNHEMIRKLSTNASLDIIKCEHIVKTEVNTSDVHAEWHVVLKIKEKC